MGISCFLFDIFTFSPYTIYTSNFHHSKCFYASYTNFKHKIGRNSPIKNTVTIQDLANALGKQLISVLLDRIANPLQTNRIIYVSTKAITRATT